ncbi:unnamed protein product [Boreogadus saida]
MHSMMQLNRTDQSSPGNGTGLRRHSGTLEFPSSGTMMKSFPQLIDPSEDEGELSHRLEHTFLPPLPQDLQKYRYPAPPCRVSCRPNGDNS